MSYEGLSLALFDDPALVKAVAERVGSLMEQMYVHLLQLPNVLGLFPGDDMGFRTATLIGPKSLRAYTSCRGTNALRRWPMREGWSTACTPAAIWRRSWKT